MQYFRNAWIKPHVLLCFGQEETLKAGAFVRWCVQSLVTLEQGGSISLNGLEAQLETLLEGIVTFNPPGDFPRPLSRQRL